MTIDYDLNGHCVVCHKNMIIEQAIDGRVQTRFTPDYDKVQYTLNTGSKMRVAMCKKCKEEGKHEDSKKVMETVYKGWKVETDDMVKDEKNKKWTKERQDKYLDKQVKLSIVSNTEPKKKKKDKKWH